MLLSACLGQNSLKHHLYNSSPLSYFFVQINGTQSHDNPLGDLYRQHHFFFTCFAPRRLVNALQMPNRDACLTSVVSAMKTV